MDIKKVIKFKKSLIFFLILLICTIVIAVAPNLPTLNSPLDWATGQPTTVTLNVTVTDDDSAYLNVSFYGSERKWFSNPSIVSGLSSTPSAFCFEEDICNTAPAICNNCTGTGYWELISGEWNGTFDGYYWNGTEWLLDSNIINGLGDIGDLSAPAICNNCTGHGFSPEYPYELIAGEMTGVFYGFNWNGTKWLSNSSIVLGLGDIGNYPYPAICNNCTGHAEWELIAGESNANVYYGFYWNSTSWVLNSSIISGLSSVTAYGSPAICNNCTGHGFSPEYPYELIATEWKNVVYGFYWNSTSWISNSSIISGLSSLGIEDQTFAICNNCTGNGWELISGSYNSVFWGFQLYNYTQIDSTQLNIANGSSANVSWSGLSYTTEYIWYSNSTDGVDTTLSSDWTFTTESDITNPSVIWLFQDPADIDTFNLFPQNLTIVYNITDSPCGLNTSAIHLYYQTNTTGQGCWSYVNGTCNMTGYQEIDYTSNSGDNFTWSLEDYTVYPGTYNVHPDEMRSTIHDSFVIDSFGEAYKVKLYNISSTKQYNILNFMADNITSGGRLWNLEIKYCNESVNTGWIGDPSCTVIKYLMQDDNYNFTDRESSYVTIPMHIDSNGMLNGRVRVSSTSYFIFKRWGPVTWNLSYIHPSNLLEPDTVQHSTNRGITWTNESLYVVDMHLNQYDGNDTSVYYVNATDNCGNNNCSVGVEDLIDLVDLPPTSPEVYTPTNDTYSSALGINITYSNSTPMIDAEISYYNISLFNCSGNFESTIAENNSLNLSYFWVNSSIIDGCYIIEVMACDNSTNCESGYSYNFTIDHTAPSITLISPGNNSFQSSSDITLSYNISETNNVTNCTLTYRETAGTPDTSINKSETNTFSVFENENGGPYTWDIACYDNLGNLGTSSTIGFYVALPDEEQDDTPGGSSSEVASREAEALYNQSILQTTEIPSNITGNWMLEIGAILYPSNPLTGFIVLCGLLILGAYAYSVGPEFWKIHLWNSYNRRQK